MLHSKIISRTEALSQGLKVYFTGKSCRNGHISERYVSSANCISCSKAQSSKFYLNHKDEVLLRTRARYAKDPESAKSYRKELYRRRSEKEKNYSRQYYRENADRCQARDRQHKKKHSQRYSGYTAKRRAAKLQRTPPWANLEGINEIYANCPKGYHVDHIHPLQGKFISGLHVENNLQYLTPSENLSKSNSFIE